MIKEYHTVWAIADKISGKLHGSPLNTPFAYFYKSKRAARELKRGILNRDQLMIVEVKLLYEIRKA